MGAIDNIFGSIPEQVLTQFGQDLTYIKTTLPRVYDPITGEVLESDTNISIKGVISEINSNEDKGVYQGSNVQILIGATELGDYYPTQADRIKYVQSGSDIEGKIVSIRTYRGDLPVYHELIVRIQ